MSDDAHSNVVLISSFPRCLSSWKPSWHLLVESQKNGNTMTRCETCWFLTIETTEQCRWRLFGVLIVTFTHCSSVSIVDYEQVNVSLEKHKIIQPLIQEIWSKDPVSLIKETCSQPWLTIFIIKGSLKKKLHKKSRLTIIWVKVFKNGPRKICGRQPFIIKNFKWYQGCLPQILLGPFLKTLTYLIQQILLIK